MAAEVPKTLEYKGGQLNAAPLLERLKSLIMSVLPDDQMNFVINCLTTKSTWDDLILYHEGPSDVKESRVMDLKLCYNNFKFKEGETLTQTFTRYKALMNELVNDGIKLSKLEINIGFINGLPKKWLSFCQSLKNTNHVKDSELDSLFGKLKYEENLIDSIYETEKKKSLVSATPLSTAFFSTSIVQDFQDSSDDEEDTRSSQEYMDDLEEEYQARSLLDKSKRFFKRVLKCSAVQKQLTKLNATNVAGWVTLQEINKGLVAEDYEWNKEDVSSDENETTKVKVLMALADDENLVVDKESARNDEWVKISIRNHRNNLVIKHRNLVQELKTCKERLLVLKQAKLDFYTMQHVNTEILKENKHLRIELKELTEITETWLNSSNKVNQCISEQFPIQKKTILGVDQLTKDPSSSGQKNLVCEKSSANDTKVPIPGVEKPLLSKAKGFIMPNHDTGKILLAESQRNTTDPPVAVTNSSATDYDSADESSVCSTPLSPLKKLDGVEPVSGPKAIKSILNSKTTFKAEALKGVIINEPSSAPSRGNKSASVSKFNPAPAGKLKNVKIKDDLPLAIVIKELNKLKLQINKTHSSYSRNNNS
ncbi:hypothetical protein Tco_0286852 [Tanacetum coccineum]